MPNPSNAFAAVLVDAQSSIQAISAQRIGIPLFLPRLAALDSKPNLRYT